MRFMVQSANTYTDTYNQCVCAVVPTNYNLDCYSRGAFPFLPAVLESYACHFVEEARRARKKGLQ